MKDVCEECGDEETLDHRCPIYYTYPGMTPDATLKMFVEFLDKMQTAGYRIKNYWFPPDRLAMLVEIGIDPSVFGEAERHDRREEVRP